MKTKFNLMILLFHLLVILTPFSYAIKPLPHHLISFNSERGSVLFKKNLTVNSLKLLSHFTVQKTMTYCGVATVVMVLNSTGIVPPHDSQKIPYPYFNQDNFFNAKVKKIITPEKVQKNGLSLRKLNEVVQSYGLRTELYFANKTSFREFRQKLRNAIVNNQFVIVNFLRTKLHQSGEGHHSPIAAYDKQTDRFLLLDVARYKYPPYWVKSEDLWKAIDTLSEDSYRGFIIIKP